MFLWKSLIPRRIVPIKIKTIMINDPQRGNALFGASMIFWAFKRKKSIRILSPKITTC